MPCPFCNDLGEPILPREKRYLICKRHDLVFNEDPKFPEYEDSYFDKEYETQYGKSYIEDKINIQNKARMRLKQSKEFLPQNGSLLEIGSAAGFFLEIAKEAGFNSLGWEISRTMVEFSRTNGQKAIQSDFYSMAEKTKASCFDVIAAFYIIEHFLDQFKFWSEVSRLVKKSGHLLIATPSHYGPMYKFHKKQWVETHPDDHVVDYSPKSIKKIANEFGWKVMHISPESTHPARFPVGWLYAPLARWYQKKTFFADTFFAILQKYDYR